MLKSQRLLQLCLNYAHYNGHELEQTPGDSEGQDVWHDTVHGVALSH